MTGTSIRNRSEYARVVECAQNRDSWKQLVSDVVHKYVDGLRQKVIVKLAKKAAKSIMDNVA